MKNETWSEITGKRRRNDIGVNYSTNSDGSTSIYFGKDIFPKFKGKIRGFINKKNKNRLRFISSNELGVAPIKNTTKTSGYIRISEKISLPKVKSTVNCKVISFSKGELIIEL